MSMQEPADDPDLPGPADQGFPRRLTDVPITNGPHRDRLARVPVEPDGAPVAEVSFNGVQYLAQRGPAGWEYVADE